MTDNLGRTIDYIRISVTDRCNLRCLYCMPEEGTIPMEQEEILTDKEILRISEAASKLGIRKAKITGGEPLIRKNIEGLVFQLSKIFESVSMTTNGCLLKEKATALKAAGLSAVNVSLDALDPVRFQEITRRDCFDSVMEGIKSGVSAGLRVKINCTVLEGMKKEEVLAFALFSAKWKIPVRFIEMMPIGQGKKYQGFRRDDLMKILKDAFGDLREVKTGMGNGPAVYYTWGDGQGMVGFISAVTHKFCGDCNRVRLTCNGQLRLCLDSFMGVDLKEPLRQGISEEELADLMKRWIKKKPASHHFEENHQNQGFNMNQIGG